MSDQKPTRARSSAASALAVGTLALCGCFGHSPQPHAPSGPGPGIFVSAGCGGCHAVASIHTTGVDGPAFDTSEKLDRNQIRTQLNTGGDGMPSFRKTLTPQQKAAVTDFVFETMHPPH